MLKLTHMLATLGLSGFAYAALHESGHFLVAMLLGLSPKFAYGAPDSSLLNFAVGVEYGSATALQSFLILAGAIILPLLALAAIMHFATKRNSEALKIATEVFLALIILSLLPLPSIPAADGSRIWAAVLAGV